MRPITRPIDLALARSLKVDDALFTETVTCVAKLQPLVQ